MATSSVVHQPRGSSEPGTHGLVFVGSRALRRHGFRKRWVQALTDAGVQPVTFHDLRHTGNTMATATGTSTRELMTRMGQSSSRAALICQHATSEWDRLIADASTARSCTCDNLSSRLCTTQMAPEGPEGRTGPQWAEAG